MRLLSTEVCVCVRVHSHHISGQVAEVVEGTLQGVGVHIQNDHILQRPTAHSLKENKKKHQTHFKTKGFCSRINQNKQNFLHSIYLIPGHHRILILNHVKKINKRTHKNTH